VKLSTKFQRSTWLLIGGFVLVVGGIALVAAMTGGGTVSRPVAPAAVPYSDEAEYTALKTRTDCQALQDLFLQVGREMQRDSGEAKRWATQYWAAVGSRVAELHCASR